MHSVPITTTCCEFESRSGRGVQHYVIKFVSDLWQVVVFLRVLRFPPSKNWPPWYNWNIVESGVKHHKINQSIPNTKQDSYTFFVRKFHDFSRTFPVFPGPTLSKPSTTISEILSNHIIYHVLTFVYEYIRNYPS